MKIAAVWLVYILVLIVVGFMFHYGIGYLTEPMPEVWARITHVLMWLFAAAVEIFLVINGGFFAVFLTASILDALPPDWARRRRTR